MSIIACSKSPDPTTTCAGSYTGTWAGSPQADSYQFTAACAFSYTAPSGSCSNAGTYAAPLGQTGTIAATISSKSGSGSCLPVGAATCAYSFADALHLTINCGGGSLSYIKSS